MDDGQPRPASVPFLRRPTTRRGLLAGGAAIAAAGTAALVVKLAPGGGATQQGSDGGAAANRSATASPQSPAAAADTPIEDARRRAAHLLRRAGFGGRSAELDEFAALSREAAADRLLAFASTDDSALNARLATATFDLTRPVEAQGWWLTRMAYTARPLQERMTLIWHGLLTSQVSKIGGQRFKVMLTQNELFRADALPKYDDLLKAVSKDPAMMIYLDTVESTREHPNENYARELMELFSMGVGNYTEDDVRETARAFTGWRITQPERPKTPQENLTEEERRKLVQQTYAAWEPQFFLAARQHDGGMKTFLGRTGTFDGDDIVDIIMEQPATGRFICTRLFMEFANYNPAPATIDRLVKVWDDSGHQVRDVVRAILVSDEFYSEASYRALVRSPVEFVVGAVRGFDLEPAGAQARNQRGARADADSFRLMDQVLFEPPSVAGWPGGATWLSSSTFFARVNYLDSVFFRGGRPAPVPALATATSPEVMVDTALARVVDGNVPDVTRHLLYDFARSVKDPAERAAGVAYLVLASPEYQLV